MNLMGIKLRTAIRMVDGTGRKRKKLSRRMEVNLLDALASYATDHIGLGNARRKRLSTPWWPGPATKKVKLNPPQRWVPCNLLAPTPPPLQSPTSLPAYLVPRLPVTSLSLIRLPIGGRVDGSTSGWGCDLRSDRMVS